MAHLCNKCGQCHPVGMKCPKSPTLAQFLKRFHKYANKLLRDLDKAEKASKRQSGKDRYNVNENTA